MIFSAIFVYIFYKKELTQFLLKFMGQQEEVLKKPIATLLDHQHIVKYKRANKLIWEPTKDKMRFEAMDSVSTESSSNAIISFFVGTMLNISEDSLVVIEEPELEDEDLEATQLKLEDGILQVRNTKENNVTIIRSGNITTTARGIASLGMKVKNKKAEIWVDEGQAIVSDNNTGKEILVRKNEYKTFNTEKLAPEPITAPKQIKRKSRFLKIKTTYKKSLSSAKIRTLVSMQRNKIDRCYQKRGVVNVKGIISLKMIVQKTGKVSSVVITKSTVKNPIVNRCVKLWIKAIKFPRFEDREQITEKIRFVFN